MASITSAGLVFAMLLSQSAVADLGTEQVKAAEEAAKWVDTEYVVNGDFESGADNWDINIPKDTENWLYGSGAEKDIIASGRIKQRNKRCIYLTDRKTSGRNL